jgi:hypothetical protein
MVLRSLTLAVSLAVFPALAVAQTESQMGHIPALHTTALSGDRVDLPEALRGHVAVLILSFSQGSRDNVTAWFKALAADYRISPTVLYYELPVLAEVPGFLRGMIVKRIKETVPPVAQPKFLPILDHEDDWKSAAGWSKQTPESDAWLILVDGAGVIRYRTAAAAPTPVSYGALKGQIEQSSQFSGNGKTLRTEN